MGLVGRQVALKCLMTRGEGGDYNEALKGTTPRHPKHPTSRTP